jgi:hypothetical protein
VISNILGDFRFISIYWTSIYTTSHFPSLLSHQLHFQTSFCYPNLSPQPSPAFLPTFLLPHVQTNSSSKLQRFFSGNSTHFKQKNKNSALKLFAYRTTKEIAFDCIPNCRADFVAKWKYFKILLLQHESLYWMQIRINIITHLPYKSEQFEHNKTHKYCFGGT